MPPPFVRKFATYRRARHARPSRTTRLHCTPRRTEGHARFWVPVQSWEPKGAINGRHRTGQIRPVIAVDSYGATRYLTIVFAALAVSRWIEHQAVLRPFGAQALVPGHGPVCGPEVIDDTLAYLRFVQDTARAGKAAGLSPLEAARATDLGEFADLLDPERIAGNLHRAYLEVDGGERGAPADRARALGDMIAYNGGRPLTCHA